MSSQAEFRAKIDVSRETFERLEAFEATLLKWNSAINLVSPSSLSQIWTRHLLDSAQIFELCPKSGHAWVDIGSGGGFPGLVVAILAKEKMPELRVSLIESDRRKAAFLATTANALDLKVSVHATRIESLAPQGADVLSARALAPLSDLLGYAERHLAIDGLLLFPKGIRWRDEILAAQNVWRFDYTTHASMTGDDSVILAIKGAQRV